MMEMNKKVIWQRLRINKIGSYCKKRKILINRGFREKMMSKNSYKAKCFQSFLDMDSTCWKIERLMKL